MKNNIKRIIYILLLSILTRLLTHIGDINKILGDLTYILLALFISLIFVLLAKTINNDLSISRLIILTILGLIYFVIIKVLFEFISINSLYISILYPNITALAITIYICYTKNDFSVKNILLSFIIVFITMLVLSVIEYLLDKMFISIAVDIIMAFIITTVVSIALAR